MLEAELSGPIPLEFAMEFQAGHRFPDLPRGPVHADLFRIGDPFLRARLHRE